MNLISKSSFPCGSRFILFIIMLFFSYIFLFQENKSKKITIIQQKMENTLQYLPFFHAASVDQCFGCTKEYRLCRVSMDKYTLRRMSFFPLSPYLEGIRLDKKNKYEGYRMVPTGSEDCSDSEEWYWEDLLEDYYKKIN